MRIAQISDLHVLDLEAVRLRDFLSKRITGGVNLLTARRNSHPIELAERLVADLTLEELDHVVVTGDVTNLSLPGEFQRVSRLLKPLGGYADVTVVPGNHDIYTRGAAAERRFESYFSHLVFESGRDRAGWEFPAIKDLGDVVIAGLCSALPTPLLTAWGRVGHEQLDRLQAALERPEYEQRFKIVALHHNLHPRTGFAEATASLKDRDDVVSRLLELKVNLVLHGHTHKPHRYAVARGGHTMYVVGSGSSTLSSADIAQVARYNIYSIEEGKLARIRTRVYDRVRRRFEWLV